MPTLQLEIADINDETPTVRSVSLALAGQPFSFKPGQYCLVKIPVGDKQLDHALSIASSPTRRDRLLFATRKSDSLYKQSFFALKPGDRVSLMGPMGRFIYDENSAYSVFLSGGIGITPLMSMIEYVADRHPDHRVILLFGNRSPGEIPFRRELDGLARSHANITVIHTVSSPGDGGETWQGETGRVNQALIQRSVTNLDHALFYICGPPGMVSGLKSLLEQLSISHERIKFENFTGYE